MHLAVLHGYQGANKDADQLGLTNLLFDAALCELEVVSEGQPTVIVETPTLSEPRSLLC